MFDCFLAQMLVLILILACCARIFFIKDARVDSFAAFSPIALAISLFIFFCFDFTPLNLFVFALALIVFFTNFRSVLRLASSLVVDNYSAVFVIFTIIELILTLLLAALIILHRPVRYSEKDFSVIKEYHELTGTTESLRVRDSFWKGEPFSGILLVYKPVIHDEITAEIYRDHPVILFSASIRANVQNYEPYLMLLAQKGYTVVAGDFYTKDMPMLSDYSEKPFLRACLESRFFRRFFALQLERFDSERFLELLKKEQSYATKKYSALTKITLELFGDETHVFYVVDGVDFDSIYAVVDEFNTEPYANAKGFFSMNRVDEYKTSGYGFIEQTDVLLARRQGIEREDKFFIARLVANRTIKAIESQK